jgi:cytosine/uracil/thiamine/allantoin permease
MPGFLKGIHLIEAIPAIFDGLYIYAWFTGFLLSGAVYLAIAKREEAPVPEAGR